MGIQGFGSWWRSPPPGLSLHGRSFKTARAQRSRWIARRDFSPLGRDLDGERGPLKSRRSSRESPGALCLGFRTPSRGPRMRTYFTGELSAQWEREGEAFAFAIDSAFELACRSAETCRHGSAQRDLDNRSHDDGKKHTAGWENGRFDVCARKPKPLGAVIASRRRMIRQSRSIEATGHAGRRVSKVCDGSRSAARRTTRTSLGFSPIIFC